MFHVIGVGTHFLVGGPYYPSQGSVGMRIKEVLYVVGTRMS